MDTKTTGKRRVGDGTPGPGRPKGLQNKATREFKATVQKLLEDNAENVQRWLLLVAEGDGTDKGQPDPAKALDLLAKLAEFAAPKLARTEHTGKDGGPIEQKRVVEFVEAKKDE